jgi:DNA excision repair protein ERCC-6-like 2
MLIYREFEVVTSFDLLRRDIMQLGDLPWTVIIVDEVHRVKNPNSSITQALHEIHRNKHIYGNAPAAARFGLTGTAIQNDYMELWTIL